MSTLLIVVILLMQFLIIIPFIPSSDAIQYSGIINQFNGNNDNVTLTFSNENSTDLATVIISPNVEISNVSFNVTGIETSNSNVSNLSLYFTTLGSLIWKYNGTISNNSVITGTDIHSEMNIYLRKQSKETNITLELIFFSETKGSIIIDDLKINWIKSDYFINSAQCDSQYDKGEIMDLSINVENHGSASGIFIPVSVYFDNSSNDLNLMGHRNINISSNSSDTITVKADTLYISEGLHDIIIVINDHNYFQEVDYSNNSYTIEDVQFNELDENEMSNLEYDFTYSNLSYEMYHKLDSGGDIFFTLINLGWGTASDVQIKTFKNDTIFETDIVSSLPGYRYGTPISIPISNLTVGKFRFNISIDHDNDFSECNENNNNITDVFIDCDIYKSMPLREIPINNEHWTSSDENEQPVLNQGPCEGRHFFNSSKSLNENNNEYRLKSPLVDLDYHTQSSPFGDILLKYNTTYNFHSNGFGQVELNMSGELTQIGTTLTGSNNSWVSISIDISNYYDKSFTIEFLYNSGYSTSSDYYWYIDDITIFPFNWNEAAELDVDSWFASGNTIDWSNHSWAIEDAFTGPGDYWSIETVDGEQVWKNPNGANLNNLIQSTPFYIPHNPMPEIGSGPQFEPVFNFKYENDFGMTNDHVDIQIQEVGQPGWVSLGIISGSSNGLQEKDVDLGGWPGLFVKMRFSVVSGTDFYSGENSGFMFVDSALLTSPQTTAYNPSGQKLMEATITFDTDERVPPTVSFTHLTKIGAYIVVSNEADMLNLLLTFNYHENPMRGKYKDSYQWGYNLTIKPTSSADKYRNKQVTTKQIDEGSPGADAGALHYTSAGSTQLISLNADQFRALTSEQFQIEIEFKVKAIRKFWAQDRPNIDAPLFEETLVGEMETFYGIWWVRTPTSYEKIETDVYMKSAASGNVVGPEVDGSGNYDPLPSEDHADENYLYPKGTDITFILHVEFNDDSRCKRDVIQFWVQLFRDENENSVYDEGDQTYGTHSSQAYTGQEWVDVECHNDNLDDWDAEVTFSLDISHDTLERYILRCWFTRLETKWEDYLSEEDDETSDNCGHLLMIQVFAD